MRVYGNTFGVISGGDNKFGSLELWLSPGFYLGLARIEILFVYGIAGVLPVLVGAWWLYTTRRGTAAASFVLAGAIGVTVYYFAAGRYTSSDLGTADQRALDLATNPAQRALLQQRLSQPDGTATDRLPHRRW